MAIAKESFVLTFAAVQVFFKYVTYVTILFQIEIPLVIICPRVNCNQNFHFYRRID